MRSSNLCFSGSNWFSDVLLFRSQLRRRLRSNRFSKLPSDEYLNTNFDGWVTSKMYIANHFFLTISLTEISVIFWFTSLSESRLVFSFDSSFDKHSTSLMTIGVPPLSSWTISDSEQLNIDSDGMDLKCLFCFRSLGFIVLISPSNSISWLQQEPPIQHPKGMMHSLNLSISFFKCQIKKNPVEATQEWRQWLSYKV